MTQLVWPPRVDETLSSWLYRQSKLHGLPPQSYTALSFPGVEIWTRDADRWLSMTAIQGISRSLGQTHATIGGTTLAGRYGGILGEVREYSTVHWVLPVGVYHRRRRRHGQQFCSECYLKNGTVKLSWRLAWNSFCEEHQRPLMDACALCDEPLTLFYTDPYRHTACFNCGHDMATLTERSQHYDLCVAFSRRFAPSLADNAPDPASLRTLMTLQLGRAQGRHLNHTWCSRIGIAPIEGALGRWEYIRAVDRRALIAATEAMLQIGLDRLVGDLIEHGVTRECLRNYHFGQGYWLEKHVYPKLSTNSRPPRSPANYKAEMADPLKQIQRKHTRVSSKARAEARARCIDTMLRKLPRP
ncbi:MAG: TniQ family protein [Marinobacter sp.]